MPHSGVRIPASPGVGNVVLSSPDRPDDIGHLIADDHVIVERQFQHLEAGRGDRLALVDSG
jgi:acetyl esterase